MKYYLLICWVSTSCFNSFKLVVSKFTFFKGRFCFHNHVRYLTPTTCYLHVQYIWMVPYKIQIYCNTILRLFNGIVLIKVQVNIRDFKITRYELTRRFTFRKFCNAHASASFLMVLICDYTLVELHFYKNINECVYHEM